MLEYTGIIGLVILVLDIWAIITILNGGDKIEKKILWIVLIIVLPIIGLLLWYLLRGR